MATMKHAMTATRAVSATAAFDEVRRHAERIRNDGAHRIEVMDVGDAWPQGDVLILRIGGLPSGARPIRNPSAQLAPGNTQGSRHVLSTMAGVKLFTPPDATPLDGPLIDAATEFTVTHPEHGDVTLPAGVYAIRYQRAYAEELRAVAD